MLKLLLGDRRGALAVFDMARRLMRPQDEWYYGQGFRIGDRAYLHAYLYEWRQRNPHRRLILLDDSVSFPDTHFSRHVPSEWFVGKLADEIWKVERPGEPVPPLPEAERLYVADIRRLWKWVRGNRTVPSRIEPPMDARMRANLVTKYLPRRYATVQPLLDAEHSVHRNIPAEWWEDFIRFTAQHMPVLVLGAKRAEGSVKLPSNVFRAYDLDPMASLSAVHGSAAHAGGETGFTIWSSVFGRPTLAVYPKWDSAGSRDVRPIPFRAPVVRADPRAGAGPAAVAMMRLFGGQAVRSTPA